jgi:hypothetical protein
MNQRLLGLYGLKFNPFSPDLPSEALLQTGKFTISEGFATATTTYRHQQTQVPDSNSVALVTSVRGRREAATRWGLKRIGRPI